MFEYMKLDVIVCSFHSISTVSARKKVGGVAAMGWYKLKELKVQFYLDHKSFSLLTRYRVLDRLLS